MINWIQIFFFENWKKNITLKYVKISIQASNTLSLHILILMTDFLGQMFTKQRRLLPLQITHWFWQTNFHVKLTNNYVEGLTVEVSFKIHSSFKKCIKIVQENIFWYFSVFIMIVLEMNENLNVPLISMMSINKHNFLRVLTF